jgi:acetylornithine/succinyldiaminopimelate/putrescine aminotransferase
MNTTASDRVARIRELNDALRTTFGGGKVMLTAGVDALPTEEKAAVLSKVQTFADFNTDNDPHGEHDMVFVEVRGQRYFAKCDYYDLSLEYGSEDPSDPTKTTRVLTIGHMSDY